MEIGKILGSKVFLGFVCGIIAICIIGAAFCAGARFGGRRGYIGNNKVYQRNFGGRGMMGGGYYNGGSFQGKNIFQNSQNQTQGTQLDPQNPANKGTTTTPSTTTPNPANSGIPGTTNQ